MYKCHEESLLHEYDKGQRDNLLDTFIGENLSLIDTQSDIVQMDGNDSIVSQTEDNTNNSKAGINKFRIIEANMNSLKGKKEELNALIEDENPDCLVLVETKLDNSYKNSEFFDNTVWNVVTREKNNMWS